MTKRIQRVNQLIKKELGQILLREVEFPKDVLVTVTRIETSVDLNQARVFLSCFPENKAKEILGILNRQIYNIQQKLNKRLKMKFIPKIEFREEKETREAGRIEEILEELKKGEK
ncbi:30S ribosome-binding factor RbfA [bacterium]|uniref:Ribosome-binding factor A n=4 Tax=Candidatus Nealsoniibacteriota TaxID=1817911 RepID=A0A2M7EB54_9BACT|nr:30S ribosome-binding factor RbfA [bacterium]PIV64976.1 MAG: ribosome-binding factor A [Candidatus Nealsonbacteria bacterium CG01_land_8_20_14_3_00_12]PIW35374.1 MAG: ribosome-binding factor A [Candidatus Nealsonbacteria bacterium CG15_BIG_FIL_POST_REV_8_21_14_020_37_12]PIW91439.1 MAG: ribosome-binding factor A [Candidatus Nealsonbacteria bacterium CG_4_8_14_3_um_filter_37_36]PJA83916.1 MAG: ribosome-binding factor A [Candidatus Nealsonbacteria bacterium CG_4_9_14_3_um_filter_37_29]